MEGGVGGGPGAEVHSGSFAPPHGNAGTGLGPGFCPPLPSPGKGALIMTPPSGADAGAAGAGGGAAGSGAVVSGVAGSGVGPEAGSGAGSGAAGSGAGVPGLGEDPYRFALMNPDGALEVLITMYTLPDCRA